MLTSIAYFNSLNKPLHGLVFFQLTGHFQESLKQFEKPYFRHPVTELATAGCVRETKLCTTPLLGVFLFNHDIGFSRTMFCESLLQRGSCWGRGTPTTPDSAIMCIAAERLLCLKCQNDSPPPVMTSALWRNRTHPRSVTMDERANMFRLGRSTTASPSRMEMINILNRSEDVLWTFDMLGLLLSSKSIFKYGNQHMGRRNLNLIWQP